MEIIDYFKTADPKVIVSYLILILGFLLFFLNLRAILRAKASETWETTKGVILSSELVKQNMTGESSTSYKPKVDYEYYIQKNTYKSKRVYFGSNIMTTLKKSKSQDIVDKYPKGREVTVYYDQTNEKISVLETGIKSEIVVGLILGIIFVLIGFLILNPEILLKYIN